MKEKDIVQKYHPNAICQKRTWGKEYYIVWYDKNQLGYQLGQGKTINEAWKSAYKNTMD